MFHTLLASRPDIGVLSFPQIKGMLLSCCLCAGLGWPLTRHCPWLPGDRPCHHCLAALPAAPDARRRGQILHGKWPQEPSFLCQPWSRRELLRLRTARASQRETGQCITDTFFKLGRDLGETTARPADRRFLSLLSKW